MGLFRNDAFAGRHLVADDRVIVQIFYAPREHCANVINKGIPRGHRDWRHCGWYWYVTAPGSARNSATVLHGPFSSSRKAYKAAMEIYDKVPA
jgi:hypothetical protein